MVVRFHGPPSALSALVPDAVLGAPEAPLAARLAPPGDERGATALEDLDVHHAPAGRGAQWLSLSLPEDLAPGLYRGTVLVDGTELEMTVSIAAELNVLVSPPFIQARAAPGATLTETFTIANTGNVRFDVPRTGAFGLAEQDSLDTAIGMAMRSDVEGEARLGRLADELADRHGGLVIVSYGEGRGALEPGDARDLTAKFRLPTELKPGRQYYGMWQLANASSRIEIDTEEAAK
ncbi:hypothetical protein [Solirubrobacter soli]|uniref:hypothetical protein n=1 Tax=Solirubrobacter soli TaxID=363832 RepID=UPI00040EB814|nr:hypothetical protein [Solirubrobacter soli]